MASFQSDLAGRKLDLCHIIAAPGDPMTLFSELKRRNVFRVATAYVVAAWLLIQVVETILPAFGYGDFFLRLVVIVLAISFVPTLVCSWVFEITPEGLKREVDVVREESITRFTGKKIDRTIMVLLALALGYFAFDKFVLEPARVAEIVEETAQQARSEALVESYGDQSIAVLPFVNMSGDPEQEYFSEGIAEELLNLLARIPELRVISRSSAFIFKGKDIDIPAIAEKLDVAHILQGSVRKAGDQVRITVQLIDAHTDTHLWSDSYDHTMDDIFAIQDAIAAEVVARLKATLLSPAPMAEETHPEAFSLYLQARHVFHQHTPEAWTQAAELYEQALDIAPDYAAAWVGLGNVFYYQAGRGFRPHDEGLQLARDAANKALDIDPEFAPAYSLLGALAMYFDNDLEAAARYVEHAFYLEPLDLNTLGQAAVLFGNLGRVEQSISLQQYLLARDPLNIRTLCNLGQLYVFSGRPDEALPLFRTALKLRPGHMITHYLLGMALLQKRDPQAALAAVQRESREPFRLLGLVMIYHALGRKNESDDALAELIEKHEKHFSYGIAYALAYRGEIDRAFQWLDKAVEYRDTGLPEIPTQSEFARLQDDPRWLPFLERIGKSPAQLAAIEVNVTLPE
ncbi:MAG: tetratricopeptide repeat protein [Gammaproteobacteria bacterium]|nr:tetratricopeptide repeat protein [Gammaproteobacteria bacterium]